MIADIEIGSQLRCRQMPLAADVAICAATGNSNIARPTANQPRRCPRISQVSDGRPVGDVDQTIHSPISGIGGSTFSQASAPMRHIRSPMPTRSAVANQARAADQPGDAADEKQIECAFLHQAFHENHRRMDRQQQSCPQPGTIAKQMARCLCDQHAGRPAPSSDCTSRTTTSVSPKVE